jgi:Peptidase C39 family
MSETPPEKSTEPATPDPAATAPAVEPTYPPAPRRRRLWIAAACVSALLIAAGAYLTSFWMAWNTLAPLEPRGGFYFPQRLELAVPSFRQNDPRWGKDPLGPTDGTLGGEGCAVSSAAMVMAFYGIDTDPQRLNQYLIGHDGYTPEGWIYWEKAADLAPQRIHKAYEDLPSYCLIDCNLFHRNPVIVRLRLASGSTHFVVIAGKEGFDYLTRDPGAGAGRGLYPLRDLGSKIYALRFYAKSQ